VSLHRLAQSAGEILDILPGGAAGPRAPRERPFERLAFDFFARWSKTEMLRVAMDHRKIIVLRTGMKTEPKPKTVGKRDLFLNRVVRVDRGSAFVFDHFAGKHMTAVRGGIK
jgi:hypothetical protein